MSRAGSPAYWIPCLSAPPSGCRLKPGSQPRQIHMVHNIKGQKGIQALTPLSISRWQTVSNRSPDSTVPLALLRLQEGETTMGIAHYLCCSGQSYSGQIQSTPEIAVNAIHCNGRHPSIDGDGQLVIWMMTNTPVAQPEDFKLLLREGIAKLCPPGIVTWDYDSLQFVTAKGEAGTQGSYLLIGLSTCFMTHLRLRDILLSQPGHFS